MLLNTLSAQVDQLTSLVDWLLRNLQAQGIINGDGSTYVPPGGGGGSFDITLNDVSGLTHYNFYAPTTKGTSGQLLVAGSPTPKWTTLDVASINVTSLFNSGKTLLSTLVPTVTFNNMSQRTQYSFYAPTNKGTSGQVLVADGSDTPKWSTLASGGNLPTLNFNANSELNNYEWYAPTNKGTNGQFLVANNNTPRWTTLNASSVQNLTTFIESNISTIINNQITTILQEVPELGGNQNLKLNNQTSTFTWFAPTVSGTNGQALVANGNIPTWTTLQASHISNLSTYLNENISTVIGDNITTIINNVSELDGPTLTFNGVSERDELQWYAPTAKGTNGQFLIANNDTPRWTTLTASNVQNLTTFIESNISTIINNQITTILQEVSELDSPDLKFNNVLNPETITWYAPTNKGTSGQVLVADGSDTPKWTTLTSDTINITDILEDAKTDLSTLFPTMSLNNVSNQGSYRWFAPTVSGTSGQMLIANGNVPQWTTPDATSLNLTNAINQITEEIQNILPTLTLNASSSRTSYQWFAPITKGADGQFLIADGSNTPKWTTLDATNINLTDAINDVKTDLSTLFPTMSLNNVSNQGTYKWFAPTTSGTNGQVIVADGSNTPKWSTLASIIEDNLPVINLNGNSETDVYKWVAPTVSGTSGQFLIADGSNTPKWTTFNATVLNLTTIINSMTDELREAIPEFNLNNASTHETYTWFAPTTSGTSGQFLSANGNSPTWTTINADNVQNLTTFIESNISTIINNQITTILQEVPELKVPTLQFNGSSQQESYRWYAPTVSGTSGQVISADANGNPIWTTVECDVAANISTIISDAATMLPTLFPTITLNGVSNQESYVIYAPTVSGTSGKVLVADTNGAPIWTTIDAQNINNLQTIIEQNITTILDNNITTIIQQITELDFPTVVLNNVSTSSSYQWFAPTVSGTQGYGLIASADGTPTWTSLSVSNVTDLSTYLNDNLQTIADNVLPTMNMNGESTHESYTWFAPTVSGTNGQALVADGSSVPTWTTLQASHISNLSTYISENISTVIENNITTIIENVTELAVPTLSFNGVSESSSYRWFAPTVSGTSGYVLVANNNGVPVWSSFGDVANDNTELFPTFSFNNSTTENYVWFAPTVKGTSGQFLVANGNTPQWTTLTAENINITNIIEEGLTETLSTYFPKLDFNASTLRQSYTWFAPTNKGTNGQVLVANGNVPTWKDVNAELLDITDIITDNRTTLSTFFPTLSLNGKVEQGEYTWYAPTVSGTSGYVLVANGSNTPTWTILTNNNVNITEIIENAVDDLSTYFPTLTLNNNSSQGSYKWFAPTTSGTSGQYLMASGNVPVWSTINTPTFTFNGEELEDYTWFGPTVSGNNGQVLMANNNNTPTWTNLSATNISNLTTFIETNISTIIQNQIQTIIENIPELNVPVLKFNNVSTYETYTWYAPTVSGTSGQFLVADASVPTWTTLQASHISNLPTYLNENISTIIENNITTIIQEVTELNGPTLTFNGESTHDELQWFAPTNKGTNGQFLVADASDTPKWTTLQASNVSDLTTFIESNISTIIENQITTIIENVTELNIPTLTFNGESTHDELQWFAPSTSGTSGQALVADGSNTPKWTTLTVENITNLSTYLNENISTVIGDNITTIIQEVTELNGPTLTFNGESTREELEWYAPTVSGTSGQFLVADASVPTWTTLQASHISNLPTYLNENISTIIENNITTIIQEVTELNGPTLTLNNSSNQDDYKWFAPTVSGTQGQFLTANGDIPTWTTLTAENIQNITTFVAENVTTIIEDAATTIIQNNITTIVENVVSGLEFPTLNLNGNTEQESYTWYAPTTSGTQGYALVADGSDTPKWTSLQTSHISNLSTYLNENISTVIGDNITTIIQEVSELKGPTLAFNGESTHEELQWFAPIVSGTSGQFLVANGNTPTWTTLEAHHISNITSFLTSQVANIVQGISDLGPTLNLNNVSQQEEYTWYAPTTSGTSGHVLVANDTNIPTWTALQASHISELDDYLDSNIVTVINNNITSILASVIELRFPTLILNDEAAQGIYSWYAPTVNGDSGQFLVATNADTPEWININASHISDLTTFIESNISTVINNQITTIIQNVTELGGPTLTLNGDSTYESYEWYAPTTSGMTGQALVSHGMDIPVWTTLQASHISNLPTYLNENISTIIQNNITTIIEHVTELEIPTLTFNGESIRNEWQWYAPTYSGADGQFVVANGDIPIWRTLEATHISNLETYLSEIISPILQHNITTIINNVPELGVPTLTFNGESTHESYEWYAPTTSGTTGQIIIADGTGTPQWTDMSQISQERDPVLYGLTVTSTDHTIKTITEPLMFNMLSPTHLVLEGININKRGTTTDGSTDSPGYLQEYSNGGYEPYIVKIGGGTGQVDGVMSTGGDITVRSGSGIRNAYDTYAVLSLTGGHTYNDGQLRGSGIRLRSGTYSKKLEGSGPDDTFRDTSDTNAVIELTGLNDIIQDNFIYGGAITLSSGKVKPFGTVGDVNVPMAIEGAKLEFTPPSHYSVHDHTQRPKPYNAILTSGISNVDEFHDQWTTSSMYLGVLREYGGDLLPRNNNCAGNLVIGGGNTAFLQLGNIIIDGGGNVSCYDDNDALHLCGALKTLEYLPPLPPDSTGTYTIEHRYSLEDNTFSNSWIPFSSLGGGGTVDETRLLPAFPTDNKNYGLRYDKEGDGLYWTSESFDFEDGFFTLVPAEHIKEPTFTKTKIGPLSGITLFKGNHYGIRNTTLFIIDFDNVDNWNSNLIDTWSETIVGITSDDTHLVVWGTNTIRYSIDPVNDGWVTIERENINDVAIYDSDNLLYALNNSDEKYIHCYSFSTQTEFNTCFNTYRSPKGIHVFDGKVFTREPQSYSRCYIYTDNTSIDPVYYRNGAGQFVQKINNNIYFVESRKIYLLEYNGSNYNNIAIEFDYDINYMVVGFEELIPNELCAIVYWKMVSNVNSSKIIFIDPRKIMDPSDLTPGIIDITAEIPGVILRAHAVTKHGIYFVRENDTLYLYKPRETWERMEMSLSKDILKLLSLFTVRDDGDHDSIVPNNDITISQSLENTDNGKITLERMDLNVDGQLTIGETIINPDGTHNLKLNVEGENGIKITEVDDTMRTVSMTNPYHTTLNYKLVYSEVENKLYCVMLHVGYPIYSVSSLEPLTLIREYTQSSAFVNVTDIKYKNDILCVCYENGFVYKKDNTWYEKIIDNKSAAFDIWDSETIVYAAGPKIFSFLFNTDDDPELLFTCEDDIRHISCLDCDGTMHLIVVTERIEDYTDIHIPNGVILNFAFDSSNEQINGFIWEPEEGSTNYGLVAYGSLLNATFRVETEQSRDIIIDAGIYTNCSDIVKTSNGYIALLKQPNEENYAILRFQSIRSVSGTNYSESLVSLNYGNPIQHPLYLSYYKYTCFISGFSDNNNFVLKYFHFNENYIFSLDLQQDLDVLYGIEVLDKEHKETKTLTASITLDSKNNSSLTLQLPSITKQGPNLDDYSKVGGSLNESSNIGQGYISRYTGAMNMYDNVFYFGGGIQISSGNTGEYESNNGGVLNYTGGYEGIITIDGGTGRKHIINGNTYQSIGGGTVEINSGRGGVIKKDSDTIIVSHENSVSRLVLSGPRGNTIIENNEQIVRGGGNVIISSGTIGDITQQGNPIEYRASGGTLKITGGMYDNSYGALVEINSGNSPVSGESTTASIYLGVNPDTKSTITNDSYGGYLYIGGWYRAHIQLGRILISGDGQVYELDDNSLLNGHNNIKALSHLPDYLNPPDTSGEYNIVHRYYKNNNTWANTWVPVSVTEKRLIPELPTDTGSYTLKYDKNDNDGTLFWTTESVKDELSPGNGIQFTTGPNISPPESIDSVNIGLPFTHITTFKGIYYGSFTNMLLILDFDNGSLNMVFEIFDNDILGLISDDTHIVAWTQTQIKYTTNPNVNWFSIEGQYITTAALYDEDTLLFAVSGEGSLHKFTFSTGVETATCNTYNDTEYIKVIDGKIYAISANGSGTLNVFASPDTINAEEYVNERFVGVCKCNDNIYFVQQNQIIVYNFITTQYISVTLFDLDGYNITGFIEIISNKLCAIICQKEVTQRSKIVFIDPHNMEPYNFNISSSSIHGTNGYVNNDFVIVHENIICFSRKVGNLYGYRMERVGKTLTEISLGYEYRTILSLFNLQNNGITISQPNKSPEDDNGKLTLERMDLIVDGKLTVGGTEIKEENFLPELPTDSGNYILKYDKDEEGNDGTLHWTKDAYVPGPGISFSTGSSVIPPWSMDVPMGPLTYITMFKGRYYGTYENLIYEIDFGTESLNTVLILQTDIIGLISDDTHIVAWSQDQTRYSIDPTDNWSAIGRLGVSTIALYDNDTLLYATEYEAFLHKFTFSTQSESYVCQSSTITKYIKIIDGRIYTISLDYRTLNIFNSIDATSPDANADWGNILFVGVCNINDNLYTARKTDISIDGQWGPIGNTVATVDLDEHEITGFIEITPNELYAIICQKGAGTTNESSMIVFIDPHSITNPEDFSSPKSTVNVQGLINNNFVIVENNIIIFTRKEGTLWAYRDSYKQLPSTEISLNQNYNSLLSLFSTYYDYNENRRILIPSEDITIAQSSENPDNGKITLERTDLNVNGGQLTIGEAKINADGSHNLKMNIDGVYGITVVEPDSGTFGMKTASNLNVSTSTPGHFKYVYSDDHKLFYNALLNDNSANSQKCNILSKERVESSLNTSEYKYTEPIFSIKCGCDIVLAQSTNRFVFKSRSTPNSSYSWRAVERKTPLNVNDFEIFDTYKAFVYNGQTLYLYTFWDVGAGTYNVIDTLQGEIQYIKCLERNNVKYLYVYDTVGGLGVYTGFPDNPSIRKDLNFHTPINCIFYDEYIESPYKLVLCTNSNTFHVQTGSSTWTSIDLDPLFRCVDVVRGESKYYALLRNLSDDFDSKIISFTKPDDIINNPVNVEQFNLVYNVPTVARSLTYGNYRLVISAETLDANIEIKYLTINEKYLITPSETNQTITHKTHIVNYDETQIGRYCSCTGKIYREYKHIDVQNCICEVSMTTEINENIVGIIVDEDKFATHGDVLVCIDDDVVPTIGAILYPTITGARIATEAEKMFMCINKIPVAKITAIEGCPEIHDQRTVATIIL
jgi:hypothetical protein